MNRPEASPKTVFEGRPSPRMMRTSRRFARTAIEAARSHVPQFAGAAEKIRAESLQIDHELQERSQQYVHTLRETLGDKLEQGVIFRPKLDSDYEIEVEAIATDNGIHKQTSTALKITSGVGHQTRLMIGATELTGAGEALSSSIPTTLPDDEMESSHTQAWVQVADPPAGSRRHDFREYSYPEQARFRETALTAMSDVETACAQGTYEAYAYIPSEQHERGLLILTA